MKPFTRARLAPAAQEIVAQLVVLRALEAAGKRARLPRSSLPVARGLPGHTVHLEFVLARSPGDCDRLLAGVWDQLQLVMPEDAEPLARVCDGYVRDCIIGQHPYDKDELRARLAQALGWP